MRFWFSTTAPVIALKLEMETREQSWERGRQDGLNCAFDLNATPKSESPDYLQGWQWGREQSNPKVVHERIAKGLSAPTKPK